MDPKGRLSSQIHFLVPLGITYSDTILCGNTLDQTHILEYVICDMVSLDDFPTLNEVLEENQKTRDRSPTIKFLEKFSQFSVEKGNKGIQKEYDYVLKYHGHKVTFDELAIMCAFMFWNEDSIYPRGILDKEQKRSLFKGGKMFQALINSSMDLGFPTKELLKANKLDKLLKNDTDR